MSDGKDDWNKPCVDILEKVRKNSIMLSEYHRKRFYHYKGFSKYFDLPILVLSIFGSSFAVGSQEYIDQKMISAISCVIGVIVSIITSIKLYLNIETSMQSELKMSKEFYSLSIEIYKTLSLVPKDRGENGLNFLQKCFGIYTKLVESSHLLTRRFKHDYLTPIDDEDIRDIMSSSSSIHTQKIQSCCAKKNIPEEEESIELPLHLYKESPTGENF